jgi:drug/metabolite transporter (DMT)-like permease
MPVAAVLFAVLMWGLTPVALRHLVLSEPPGDVLVYRVAVSGVMAAAVLLVTGAPRIARADWPRLVLAAWAGNLGYQALSIFGLEGVPASWTGVIYGLEPIFIALFAAVLAGERPGRALYIGFALAIAGTGVLLVSAGVDPAGEVSPWHLLLVTASTMGWGLYTILIAPLAQRYGSFGVSQISLAVSAVPTVIFMGGGFFGRAAALPGESWATVMFLAVFATVLAVAFWNYGVAHMPKAVAGLFLYAQPLVATVAGWALLGEPLTPAFFAGGALILAGLAVAQRGAGRG